MAQSAQNTAPETSKPRYDVLVADSYKSGAGEDKVNWIRVGVAFPHADGKGFKIQLKALPLGGELVMLLHERRED
jgi:hypothetical protein